MKYICAWCGSVSDETGTCCDEMRHEMCPDCEQAVGEDEKCGCDDEEEDYYGDDDDEDEEE